MKIAYVTFTNFANIKTAMDAKTIEIDFRKGKNKIILITGPNGGGKTSILSCLHPFAYNGNLDIRSDNSLVIVGEDGYKEIHYIDEDDYYIIKHFYTHVKESHTVKSYIEKNGTELNPNGNQSSFKEIVKTELDIEPDYLKLVRLGNNVTNFIDHKTTDRKAFMGKILDEVEIYLKFYKKVNKDMIELKSVISHLLDKIYKLGIDDLDELNKVQDKLRDQMKDLSERIKGLNGELSVIQHEFSKYDSPFMIKEQLTDVLSKKKKVDKVLEKRNAPSISAKDCDQMIETLKHEMYDTDMMISVQIESRDKLRNQQNKLLEEFDNIRRELIRGTKSTQITDLEHIIKSIKDRIDERCKQFGIMDEDYPYDKKELEQLIVTLDLCNDILYTTYEFGKDPVHKAIDFIINHDDINSYVEGQQQSLKKNKLQAMSEFILKSLTDKHLPKPECHNSTNCEVMQFFDKLYDLATEIPDIIVEDETFVTYTKLCYQNISTILQNLREKKSTFEKLPKKIQDMFTLEVLFDRMRNLQSFYVKEPLYAELSKVTEWELMKQDTEALKLNREKLSLLRSTVGNTLYFENRKREILSEIDEIKDEINKIGTQISKLRADIAAKEEERKLLEDVKSTLEQKDNLDANIDRLQNVYAELVSLAEKKKEITTRLDAVMFDFNKVQSEFNNNDYKIRYYHSYNDELKKYNETYDEMTLIKSALSSKEGIPLLFIQIYLKNVQEVTNEMLEIIYGNELSIDDFIITADEFQIPYYTKGTMIKDVCYASQGERSFISLALSFALIYQSISRYNILLLDEIDATLDTSNRSKFLQILEKHINMIEGEQVFVISHNNMFNMYPVDVINTKNNTDENNRLAHYLQIKKS